MNKTEIILEIMNVYDKLEKLEMLSKIVATREDKNTNKTPRMNNVELCLLKIGKEKILSNIISSWDKKVKVNEDDDGNKIVQTFENWLPNVLNKSYIPNELSQKELLDYLNDDIEEIYKIECKEALYKLEAK